MSPSIVAASNSSEPFLPSSVPLIKRKVPKKGVKKWKRTQLVSLNVTCQKKERKNHQMPTVGAA
jgi:hypothetical protein